MHDNETTNSGYTRCYFRYFQYNFFLILLLFLLLWLIMTEQLHRSAQKVWEGYIHYNYRMNICFIFVLRENARTIQKNEQLRWVRLAYPTNKTIRRQPRMNYKRTNEQTDSTTPTRNKRDWWLTNHRNGKQFSTRIHSHWAVIFVRLTI